MNGEPDAQALDETGAPQPRRRLRDRRGRGLRGPAVAPLVAAPHTVPGSTSRLPTSRSRFDRIVLGLVQELDARWSSRLGLVEYGVEDTPLVPPHWSPDTVPLSSLVRGSGAQATRLVLFRRPIERRCEGRDELEALVLTVLVEQFSELLGIPPDQVDPRYRA